MNLPATAALMLGWHHHDGGVGWGIAMLVFWGTVIALVVWLVRGRGASRADTPDEILRRRLADGSISVEEYEQRRAALDAPAQGDGETRP